MSAGLSSYRCNAPHSDLRLGCLGSGAGAGPSALGRTLAVASTLSRRERCELVIEVGSWCEQRVGGGEGIGLSQLTVQAGEHEQVLVSVVLLCDIRLCKLM
jgi:hypothetical protein